MALSAKTQACLNAIAELPAGKESIVAAIYSHCFGLATTSAVFRAARKQGLIEEYATGGMNNPIYRRTAVGKTIIAGPVTLQ